MTSFVWDGDHVLMELSGTRDLIREYTYLPGTDRPHTVRGADGAAYYYQLDDPGNVVGLTDASNQVVARFRYDPWRQSELNQSLVPQPLGYQAAHRSASGLVYLRNRWYDPALGRFLSEDPIGLAGGINRYAFLGNAPMDARDPNGLCPEALVYDAESNSLECPSGGAGATLSGITATANNSPSFGSINIGSLSRGYTGSAFVPYTRETYTYSYGRSRITRYPGSPSRIRDPFDRTLAYRNYDIQVCQDSVFRTGMRGSLPEFGGTTAATGIFGAIKAGSVAAGTAAAAEGALISAGVMLAWHGFNAGASCY